jgi:hypothetical protein
LGVGIEEYNRRWDVILRRLGGSLGTPSGWGPYGNFHSCAKPQVYVPHPERLNDDQRKVIIEDAEHTYLGSD